jgi:hypothetical protein
MIRQDFALPPGTNGPGKGNGHIWEVRHAGLLGIKYEVAVRSDVVGAASEDIKAEGNVTAETVAGTELVVKMESVDVSVNREDDGWDAMMEDIPERNGARTATLLPELGPQHILQDVVDAAVLG